MAYRRSGIDTAVAEFVTRSRKTFVTLSHSGQLIAKRASEFLLPLNVSIYRVHVVAGASTIKCVVLTLAGRTIKLNNLYRFRSSHKRLEVVEESQP